MDIGIGLPNSVPGTTGAQLLEWARRADTAGFSTLASIGRVAYPSYEELTVFAAAAAVTERIRFMPNILLAPTRSTAELAKQALTVDQLSGGRLTLGLGVGIRPDDFELTGRGYDDRGPRFDEELRDLRRAFAGEPLTEGGKPVGPPAVQPGGIPVMIGGSTGAAVRRTVEHGIGWTAGGVPPEMVLPMVERIRNAWRDAGRDGEAHIAALAYYSVGDVEERSRDYLLSYYAIGGPQMAEMIASSALRTPEAIRGAVKAFADVGVDELLLDATVSDPDQVERLAEVVL